MCSFWPTPVPAGMEACKPQNIERIYIHKKHIEIDKHLLILLPWVKHVQNGGGRHFLFNLDCKLSKIALRRSRRIYMMQ